jgi:hypothetical protein
VSPAAFGTVKAYREDEPNLMSTARPHNLQPLISPRLHTYFREDGELAGNRKNVVLLQNRRGAQTVHLALHKGKRFDKLDSVCNLYEPYISTLHSSEHYKLSHEDLSCSGPEN